MNEDRWRTRLRWVVVHPHDPAVLLARRDGALAPARDRAPGQAWTADPAEVPALGELPGADASCWTASTTTRTRRPGCSGRPCWPSGSRPTRPRPCSSTRGWSWAPWPGCSPARCRLRWPSSPNGGWMVLAGLA